MLKLAIVGGGPSAFYVASRVLQESNAALRVHIYDRVWAPYGLVRYGVAPDHPDVKNCTHKFAATAADPRLRFFGNVHVGTGTVDGAAPAGIALPLAELFPHYTHLLLAPGAPLARTLPALPHLPPALSLVHWYTAHPDAPPTPPVPAATRHLTILGLGNVSLDAARILLTHPAALAPADIPAPVLAALARLWPALRHVAIVGRRGPRAARWAPRELRELLALPHARLPPLTSIPDDDFTGASRQEARILRLLRAGSTAAPADAPKSLSLHFYQAPLAHAPGGPLVLEDTRTRAHSTLHTDCVLASLGFAGDSAPWPADWFDPAAGHLRHHGGRIVTPAGALVRNVYVSGWAAHGARGVIASTLIDAKDVAARILADYDEPPAHDAAHEVMPAHVPDLDSVPAVVREGVAAGRVPGWKQWSLVDQEEKRRGEAANKERERMDWHTARAFLNENSPA